MPHYMLIKKIHVAKRELALDEETYRTALENVTGKCSAADLTNEQVLKCLRHFKDLGWGPKSKPKKYDDQRGDKYSATPAQKRMIEAMWHDIYRGNSETKHLRQFLFNHFKVSDIRFLERKTAHDVIEALKAMQKRRTYADVSTD